MIGQSKEPKNKLVLTKSVKLGLVGILLGMTGYFAEAQVTKGIAFQMRVRDPSGNLVDSAAVNIKVQILGETFGGISCVLREETFSLSKITNGYVGLAIGTGTRSGLDPNKSFAGIFSNKAAFTGLSCLDSNGNVSTIVSSYTPTANDSRRIKVSFDYQGYTIGGEFRLRANPYSVLAEQAAEAEKLGGKLPTEFLQIPSGQSSYQDRVNSLVDDTGYSTMSQILSGSYSIPSARVTGLGPLATKSVSGTGNSSNYLRGDGTWATVPINPGTVTSVSGTAPISVTDGTSAAVIAISDATTMAKGAVQVGTGLSVSSGIISLPDTGSAGTYGSNYQVPVFSTDAKGRVTGVTNTSITINAAAVTAGTLDVARLPNLDWSIVTTGKPTTLSGYGITNAITNGGGASVILSGADASKGAAGVSGKIYFATDTGRIYYDNGSTWTQISSNLGSGGTVTSVSGGGAISVSNGTTTPVISVATANGSTTGVLSSSDWSNFNNKLSSALSDAQIFVGSASNVATGVTISGDASLSNSGVLSLSSTGVSAGTYTKVTVDAKGRVTSAGALSASDIPVLDASKVNTGVLPVARGGTNSTSTLSNDRIMISVGGAIVESAAITGSRALISNSSGIPEASAVTSTELGYLSGVSSAIQTQLGAKASTGGWSNYSVIASNGSGQLTAIPGSSAGQMLNWTVTGPAWTSALYPSSTTANQLLFSSSNNVIGGLSTANNSVLFTNGLGQPEWLSKSDDHFNQYVLKTGRSGGQTIHGGIAAAESLTLDSTSSSTKGAVLINPSGGNVGIGSTSANFALDVAGDVNLSTGSVFRINGNQICSSAGCTSSSDFRLKKDIQPLENSLDKILSLQGVQYNWKNQKVYGNKHQIGFIAQDLEKVYPEVVVTDPESGLKSVAYAHLIAPVIESIRELHRQIQYLFSGYQAVDRKLANLEQQLTEKEQRIQKLEAEMQLIKDQLNKSSAK